MENDQSFWCAVQVGPNHERLAAAHLAAKQHVHLLPLYHTKRRWSDRTKELTLPLFPGYLFCRYTEGRRADILSTCGVIRILGYGGKPARVDDGEVEAIRAATQSGLTCSSTPYLTTGDMARIERGALKGLTGIVVAAKHGKPQLILSVTLLQRSVAVAVDADCLSPVRMEVGIARYASYPGVLSHT
jgi:transcription antitermination factor NusG